jgi:hypothetical protein
MTTIVQKNYRKDWEAETRVEMPELGLNKFLDITTTKRYSGNLVTTASVCTSEGGMDTHMMYQDFNIRFTVSGDRCTKANVSKQHKYAVSQLNFIKLLALAHYKKGGV